ncbi:MAG TPA: ATP-dependent sacrificial sulfur transferase LarE [Methanospirillum sp.]|nr:ATP-dependent sacrificial sulfur transferase LarE [Methanospirillum sp.]
MMINLSDKLINLEQIIRDHAPILIAYSGGVDSSLLAAFSRETLGYDQMVCIMVDGPEVPRRALREAITTAEYLNLPLEIVTGVPLAEDLRQINPNDRCRHCKLGTYQILAVAAQRHGCGSIADGANISDLGEHRPGIEAFSSCGVIHPFIMAGITKAEIRVIAEQKGLSFWNKPSSACLYSRIPYGTEITKEKLRMIEQGEDILVDLGFTQVRVRHHGLIARIELLPGEMDRALTQADLIDDAFRKIGFAYVTLDLRGYRSGSMDEVLSSSG